MTSASDLEQRVEQLTDDNVGETETLHVMGHEIEVDVMPRTRHAVPICMGITYSATDLTWETIENLPVSVISEISETAIDWDETEQDNWLK